MENLAKMPKESILCTYDLKGSTYDRQVLEKSIIQNPTVHDGTFLKIFQCEKILKDLDFKQREKKMIISK